MIKLGHRLFQITSLPISSKPGHTWCFSGPVGPDTGRDMCEPSISLELDIMTLTLFIFHHMILQRDDGVYTPLMDFHHDFC